MFKGRLLVSDDKVIDVQREMHDKRGHLGNRGQSRCARYSSGGLIWGRLYFSIADSV